MNICNYIINNEKLYGLITVILNTGLHSYEWGFTMWVEAIDDLIMTVDKYRTYSNKAYWEFQVSTARKYREYYFVKMVTPNEHTAYIWNFQGV